MALFCGLKEKKSGMGLRGPPGLRRYTFLMVFLGLKCSYVIRELCGLRIIFGNPSMIDADFH